MDEDEDVVVKVEDEMGIFVKEESIIGVSNVANYDDNASLDLDNLLVDATQLRCVSLDEMLPQDLMIYTTKLDDMLIWGEEWYSDNPSYILDKINKESRPVWTGVYKEKERKKFKRKFNRLKKHIEQYNKIVAKRNKKKCKNNYTKTQQERSCNKTNNQKQTVTHTDLDDDKDPSIDDSSDNIAIDKVNSISTVHTISKMGTILTLDTNSTITKLTDNLGQNLKQRMIIMHTLRFIFCDVYFVNMYGVPVEYYRVTSKGLKTIMKSNVTNICIDSCCWYKRDERIKNKVTEDYSISDVLQRFIKIPHGCYTGKCFCCCKRKPFFINYFSNIMTPKAVQPSVQRNYLQSRWHRHLLLQPTQQNPNSIINSALKHTPKRKIVQKKDDKRDCYRNTCLKLQIKADQSRAYYFGNDGLINSMVSTNLNPDTSFALKYLKCMMAPCHFLANENVCCLTKYKSYLLKLTALARATVVKFLMNSSLDVPVKCINCENIEIQSLTTTPTKTVTVPIHLPKYPKHTKNNVNTTRQNTKIMKKSTVENRQIEEPDKIVMPKSNCQKVNNSTQTVTVPVIEESVNMVMPIHLPNNPKHTKNSFNTTARQNKKSIQKPAVENKQIEESVNIAKPTYHKVKNSNTVISHNNVNLINLDVENLELTIFSGGIVKIQTKSLPEYISTENLKVLREILRHANDKVASLRFDPAKSISVSNLFTSNPIKKDVNKPHRTKVISSTIQGSFFDKIIENSIKNNLVSVTTKVKNVPAISKGKFKKHEHDKNMYQAFTTLYAEKRIHYLNSYKSVRDADTSFWANAKLVGYNEVVSKDVKRKMIDIDSSPPPKQKRVENSFEKVALSNSPIPVPSTSGIKQNTPMSSKFNQNDTLRDGQIPNAAITILPGNVLPNNVTVIPIAQLPEDMVISLYNQCGLSITEVDKLLNEMPLNSNNIVDYSMFSNSDSLVSSVQIASDVIPVAESTMPEIEENVIVEDSDDECIIGI